MDRIIYLHKLSDTYNVNLEYSPKVRQLFKRLSAVLKKEIERMKDMMALSGTIELLLAAGNAGKVSGNFNNDTPSDVLLSNNTLNGKTL